MRFKDVFSIIGPSMVGPSSSHTAGAARLGRAARQLLGEQPKRVDITFYGSFAETYKGHCTDLAIVGGILDYETDNPQMVTSLEDAEKMGLQVNFRMGHGHFGHPNTAAITLYSDTNVTTMKGSSIGGGNIEVQNVNGFEVRFTGNYPTIVIMHQDYPGMLASFTTLLQRAGVNIGHLSLDRKGRSADALTVIEMDHELPAELLQDIAQLERVKEVHLVNLNKRGNV
ncbi:L-serine ammonia-lyase, iron-sulfur-dependent subunit beta [Paenibacillus sp. KN14-4R]|uniref:L-serine ammonia-lyase, iron-sulfur-dependent subunit beta n=1 Tax=Paenibacillus sp. KN14-4R TaxID=3445773 RepID=UPI003F9FD6F5